MENSLAGLDSRFEQAEERLNELKDRTVETGSEEDKQKEKII